MDMGQCSSEGKRRSWPLGGDLLRSRKGIRSRSGGPGLEGNEWREHPSRLHASLLWDSPLRGVGAIPKVGHELVQALRAIGCVVLTRDDVRCPRGLTRARRQQKQAVRVHLRFLPAIRFRHKRFISKGHRVGYTFCESTALSLSDIKALDRLDLVLVPSNFCKDVVVHGFRQAGLSMPVKVVPHGALGPAQYTPPRAGGPTVFLSVAASGKRKGRDILASVFECAFPGREDVELRAVGSATLPSCDPRIKQLGVVSDEALREQMLASHCVVLPTRGEGFCLPALEAGMYGRTCILTAWSGHLDFAGRGDDVYLLDVERMVPRDDGGVGCGNWAEPSHDHLVELLRHVHQNRSECVERGLRYRQRLGNDWSWQAAAESFVRALAILGG